MQDTAPKQLANAQQHMMAGRFQEALDTVGTLLNDTQPDQEALYISAVAHRYLGDFKKAAESLDELKRIAPEFGRAHQEEGHLLRAQGRDTEAIRAYGLASHFNPALEASWRALAELQAAANNIPQAALAEQEVKRLQALPRELLAVKNHLAEGRLLKAEKLCRAYLQKHKHHIEAMRLLAEIASRFSVLDEAEFLLESAHEFAPNNRDVHRDYVQVLTKRQKFDAALEQAAALSAAEPDNLQYRSIKAIAHLQVGDIDAALAGFDHVLEKLPQDPATLTSRGHALKTHGQQDAAVDSYRRAYTARPNHGDAYYGLANLKTYRFTAQERSQMQQRLADPHLMTHDRININFALAKALEDEGNYKQAFQHYQQGNALKKATSSYKAGDMTADLKAQAQVATPDLMNDHLNAGCQAPDPIFIVGLPRAGSTLLEQILASHSQIDGTLELPHILATAHRLRGRPGNARYPDIIAELSDEQAEKLGQNYIEQTRIHRGSAPFFTDKMPNNFRHIALIRRILPKARIIDARRDAMACCFSGFKQLFAEGQEFSYDLSDIGTYYRDYVALMDHFDSVMPGAILRVQYEDVVADLEGQVRRILDYLNLPFEDACINFHKTERAVRTASSEQVRERINKKGLAAWKPFEPWLGPLKAALGPLAEH